jgi:hypothetical protein
VGAADAFTPESAACCGAGGYAARLLPEPAAAAQARGPLDGEGDGIALDEDDDTSLYTLIKLHLPPPFGTPQL